MQQILTEGFQELGLAFPDTAGELFSKYFKALETKNAVMNLTAIHGKEDTARLHFLDCAALLSVFNFKNASVIDVGTGAGFPGLPLLISDPTISLTLLDSHGKRMTFLQDTCHELGLDGIKFVCERAEEAATDIGGSFDIAVSRAVARLNILCELCMPFLHVGGTFIAMKGPDCAEELLEAKNAIELLGGGDAHTETYTIPGTNIIHSAVLIKKIRPTPAEYPRPFGRIKKFPL